MNIVSLISDRLTVITDLVDAGGLDLSPNQLAELEKLLNIIQLIISDGITENETNGLLSVMGAVGQMLPSECQPLIAEIRKEIIELKRDMLGLDEGSLGLVDAFPDAESDPLDAIGGGLIGSNKRTSPVDLKGSLLSGLVGLKNDVNDIQLHKAAVQDPTLHRRLDLSEKMLRLVMDALILPDKQMDDLSKALDRIGRRSSRPDAASVDSQPLPMDNRNADSSKGMII